MKKTLTSMFVPLLLTLSLVGCTTAQGGSDGSHGGNSSASQGSEGAGIVYSNLTDSASREEVAGVLQGYGVTKEQTDTLFAWTDQFNERVKTPELPQGLVDMKGKLVDYSNLILTYPETEDELFPAEANCRLSAYLLMRGFIQTDGEVNEEDTYLMFDVASIDSEEMFRMSQQDRTNFITMYNNISVKGKSSLKEHIQAIQEAWTSRKIQLSNPEGLSLISVYLHSPFDEVRFVGHTGILAETEDGLLFVEKYGPEGPFQATKFHNREELKTYLLARPDLYGDGTEVEPVIFENGDVMA